MKRLILILSFLSTSVIVADEMLALQKKHRHEYHEESKKWDKLDQECKSKYPNWFKASHADYDSDFKCREDINDLRAALRIKQDKEYCEKFKVFCKDGGPVADAD
jgi:hypothetical protein